MCGVGCTMKQGPIPRTLKISVQRLETARQGVALSQFQSIAVDSVELHAIRLQYVHPFETSFRRETHRPSILVRVNAQGMSGWGECVAGSGPWYSSETLVTARHILTDYLIPRLLNTQIQNPGTVVQLFKPIRGHGMAKAALENALWDLWGQLQGQSVSQMLGGTRSEVPVGVSVGIESTLPELEDRVTQYVEEGYQRVKLKIKPGWDVSVVERIRNLWPDLQLQVDANSAYTLADLGVFKAMDDLDLLLIEQPLHYEDMVEHAELQKHLQTPICLDESIHSPHHAAWALRIKACGNINIKVGRVGGLSAALEIHDLCQEAGIPVWCGGMLETNVGRACNVALASLPNFSLPGDISASARYFHKDIASPDFFVTAASTVEVPSFAGLGVQVSQPALRAVTEFSASYA